MGSRGHELLSRLRRSNPAPRPARPSSEATGSSTFADLDAAFQRLLAVQARVRRAAATVATSRKQLELQIDQLAGQASKNSGGSETHGSGTSCQDTRTRETSGRRLADLRRQYEATQAEEERVSAASRRLQIAISAFLDAREAAEAACITAEQAAEAAIAEVTGSAGRHPG